MGLSTENKRLLTNIKASIKKEFDSDSFLNNEIEPIDVISTGSIKIDKGIGVGGLPRGRIVEIFGEESCGKTTLATLAMIEAQRVYEDEVCGFIDVEHSYNLGYAQGMGLDLTEDRLVISQPNSGEEALATVLRFASSGMFSVLVVDSVAGLMTKSQLEKGIGEATMAEVARIMSQSLAKIAAAAKRSNTLVLFINQERATMDMYGPKSTTMGGKALKYWASLRMKLRKTDVLTDSNKNPIGQTIEIKLIKNKVGTPFGVLSVNLLFGYGFDKLTEIVDEAIIAGLVEQGGAWFTYLKGLEGEQRFQGKHRVVEYFRNDEEEYEKLLAKLLNYNANQEVLKVEGE